LMSLGLLLSTVTSVPMALKKWAISHATRPPPTIIMLAGLRVMSQTVLLVMYGTSPRPVMGGIRGLLPVTRNMLGAVMRVSPAFMV